MEPLHEVPNQFTHHQKGREPMAKAKRTEVVRSDGAALESIQTIRREMFHSSSNTDLFALPAALARRMRWTGPERWDYRREAVVVGALQAAVKPWTLLR